MIAYLQGKSIYHGANYTVVETGGIGPAPRSLGGVGPAPRSLGAVGYKVFVCPAVLDKKEVELFIYHYIREDTNALYGFETKDELEIFELLLSVSGVGPKAALAIITGLGAQKIISAIGRGDATLFKTISGIGGKVAAKIIVELKNKVEGGTLTTSLLPEEDETVEALASLGYKKHEIIPYLKDIPESATTTQEKIKFVLKNVGRSRK